ncbi:MAG: alanine--tRNA ligase [Deinococcales bacterium]
MASADETGPITGSGDRFIEIWNLVFMQFELKDDGSFIPLPQQSIDTGMGLERISSVILGVQDGYATDLFKPTLDKLSELTELPYQGSKSVPQRIIADHIRSVSFAIADGISPANDGAGYVVKMLIRRALRQAYLLGIKEPILYKLVPQVVKAMGEAYPDFARQERYVASVIEHEEKQFLRTLEAGMTRVEKLFAEIKADQGNPEKLLSGELAFDLWQTYGFPLDITLDMAEEQGITVDKAGYQVARAKARELSRAESDKGALFGDADMLDKLLSDFPISYFEGYESLMAEVSILGILKAGQLVDSAQEGDEVDIILDRTPFYAESGGQIGDQGLLYSEEGRGIVLDTQKNKEGIFRHRTKVTEGHLKVGDSLSATVDLDRLETAKHHSATHLLHQALRDILGEHVAQAGSLVEPKRLRFDFSHPKALDADQVAQIEHAVNRWIQADKAISWKNMLLAEARKTGAMMLFGEKYGDVVRVVSMGSEGDYISRELCGGIHVERTGNIGMMMIESEEAVSAGIRRIEALVGQAAIDSIQHMRAMNSHLAKQLNTKVGDIPERVERLQQDYKASQREIAQLREKLAAVQTATQSGGGAEVKEAGGFRYSSLKLEALDSVALRNAADSLLQKTKADVVALASGGALVVKVSKEAEGRGAHAGNIIRELAARADGKGGGRPDMAQAGVKDEQKIPQALAALGDILNNLS